MKYAPYIVIALLLVVMFFMRDCGRSSTPAFVRPPLPEPVTVTVPVPVKVYVIKPVLYAVHDTVIKRALLTKKDSANIIAKYFLVNQYNSLIKDDSLAKLFLHATVFGNEMTKAYLSGTFFQKTTTVFKYIEVPAQRRNKLFIGGMLSGNLTSFGATPSLLLVTKRDNAYSGGFDLIQRQVQVGMWFKIGRK